ncbi:hypothetical protein J6590_065211 [Homalodisca vitripennis]|nr:hypothetical protein J6590_065211 [Homalodisca vitripennis]
MSLLGLLTMVLGSEAQTQAWGRRQQYHSAYPHTRMQPPPSLVFNVNPLQDSLEGFTLTRYHRTAEAPSC